MADLRHVGRRRPTFCWKGWELELRNSTLRSPSSDLDLLPAGEASSGSSRGACAPRMRRVPIWGPEPFALSPERLHSARRAKPRPGLRFAPAGLRGRRGAREGSAAVPHLETRARRALASERDTECADFPRRRLRCRRSARGADAPNSRFQHGAVRRSSSQSRRPLGPPRRFHPNRMRETASVRGHRRWSVLDRELADRPVARSELERRRVTASSVLHLQVDLRPGSFGRRLNGLGQNDTRNRMKLQSST